MSKNQNHSIFAFFDSNSSPEENDQEVKKSKKGENPHFFKPSQNKPIIKLYLLVR
jgi:hypothetical protein